MNRIQGLLVVISNLDIVISYFVIYVGLLENFAGLIMC